MGKYDACNLRISDPIGAGLNLAATARRGRHKSSFPTNPVGQFACKTLTQRPTGGSDTHTQKNGENEIQFSIEMATENHWPQGPTVATYKKYL